MSSSLFAAQELQVLESATVVAWAYVAEMRDLSLAHAARPDDLFEDADDDPASPPPAPAPRPPPSAGTAAAPAAAAVTAAGPGAGSGDLEACSACVKKEGQRGKGRHAKEGARRAALSRCFGRGHILVQRNGNAPQVRGREEGLGLVFRRV